MNYESGVRAGLDLNRIFSFLRDDRESDFSGEIQVQVLKKHFGVPNLSETCAPLDYILGNFRQGLLTLGSVLGSFHSEVMFELIIVLCLKVF